MVFEIVEVTCDFRSSVEPLGTKEKFWIDPQPESDSKRSLFKQSRSNTGEHWSEKIAEQLCLLLGIPHAKYELARCAGHFGVITESLVPKGWCMVMGNEVLHKDSPVSYPEPRGTVVQVKQHTVSRVLDCLDRSGVLPPLMRDDAEGLNAGDYFCGYLMLDALISNQDRHHENWAIIVDAGTGDKYLCSTYDHAASLGRELTDTERKERLTTKDVNRTVECFVRKARSQLFGLGSDRKPLLTVDAFLRATGGRCRASAHWLSRLKQLSKNDIDNIVYRIPGEVMSEPAREFSLRMILENKKRLLHVEE